MPADQILSSNFLNMLNASYDVSAMPLISIFRKSDEILIVYGGHMVASPAKTAFRFWDFRV
jgi:hypothetical protein